MLGERLVRELCCSRPLGGGAPVGAARGTGLSPSGSFLLTNPLPAVILVSRIPGGRAQYTRYALDRPTAGRRTRPPPTRHSLNTAGPTDCRPHHARPPSRNDEENREGDCLELALLLKETIPSKGTSQGRKRRRKRRRRGERRRRSTQRSDWWRVPKPRAIPVLAPRRISTAIGDHFCTHIPSKSRLFRP